MKISGAIFDVDGTLLDSMSIWDTIGADYLRSVGYEPHIFEAALRFLGTGKFDLV